MGRERTPPVSHFYHNEATQQALHRESGVDERRAQVKQLSASHGGEALFHTALMR